MTRFVRVLAIILTGFMASVSGLSAAGLDNYYLERFGELKSHTAAISGVSQVQGSSFERCYTPVYHSLRHDWPKLAAGTQQVLAKYVAKPVLSGEALYDSPGGHFTIHYATSGEDAFQPPSDYPTVIAWVQKVAETFETVYAKEVLEMGYASAPTGNGQRYDVYLQNIGSGFVRYLGLTNSVASVGGASYTSYTVIDNDFAEFSHERYSATDYLQITAAHEYHHAIQYGYNYYFDIWYAEATSTWIEDEVFDSVNQLYDYLPAWFLNMELPLDAPVNVTTGGGYGRWLFNRHIAETRGRDMVRSIWVRLAQKGPTADGYDIPMIPILDEQLGGLGAELIDFGKKLALRNWASHQNEIPLIHPLLPSTGTTPLPLSAFPVQPYSLAFFSYPLYSSPGIDISAKPDSVLSGTVSTSQSDILVLCNSESATGLTGASNSDVKGGGCFIATAAYGSYMHPKVIILREFRDRWLITNPAGRMVVKFYYRISPSVAAVIARHEWARQATRAFLAPVIAMVEHSEIFSSLALGLLGWLLVRRRITA